MRGVNEHRRAARTFARDALERGEPLAWFEELYASGAPVPWVNGVPDPWLVRWLDGGFEHLAPAPVNARCLVVGAGLGFDAVELAGRGHDVVAFDVSATCVERARTATATATGTGTGTGTGDAPRVAFEVADLFDPPTTWRAAFDLVVEINTLQVLPRALRDEAYEPLARCLAPGGVLFVCARERLEHEDAGAMPWPLVADELDGFVRAGLAAAGFERFVDDEDPPVPRLVAAFTRSES